MKFQIAVIVASIALLAAFWSARAPGVSAQAPTEEPTKAPYIFPTPIYIPNFPDESPTPGRGTPTATRPASQPVGEQTYTIQSGDSPWAIAQKVYGDGTKYKLILDANGMTADTKLRVGAVLKIPASGGILPTATPAAVEPTAAPTLAPTSAPTLTTPTRTPTPAASSWVPGSITDAMYFAINLISGILFIGGMGAAVLAYLSFTRTRRLQQMSGARRPLRIR